MVKNTSVLSNQNKKEYLNVKEIKNKLVEWSLSSNIQCYPKMFQYENIYMKALWLICFLIFTFLTFWLVIKGVFDFLEFDVVTKIGVYNEDTVKFPIITLCDANLFTTKEAEILLNKEAPLDENFLYDLGYSSNQTDEIRYIKRKMDFIMNGALKKVFSMNKSQRQSLGFDLNKTLQSCYFNKVKCNSEDFLWVFSFVWGNCYQFGQNKTIQMSGRRYGLDLYLGPLSNENKYPTFPSKGLRIFVHNRSFLSSPSEEIFVKTGEHANIAIKKTYTYKQPPPYSECNDLSDLKSNFYDKIKELNIEYHQKDCFEICMQTIIIENCQCFATVLPIFGNSLPCTNSSQTDCYIRHLSRNDYLKNNCAPGCPKECNDVKYDFTLSSFEYPSEHFFNALKQESHQYRHTSFEEYKKTHLALSIFLPSLEYTEISEIPKITAIDMISATGGALGIFLGLSIFSFIEILEIFFQLSYDFIIPKKKT